MQDRYKREKMKAEIIFLQFYYKVLRNQIQAINSSFLAPFSHYIKLRTRSKPLIWQMMSLMDLVDLYFQGMRKELFKLPNKLKQEWCSLTISQLAIKPYHLVAPKIQVTDVNVERLD